MRIASFNIHHAAPVSGPVDLAATAAVIDRLGADVVVVQEVDRHSGRSGRVDQARLLGKATSMHAWFAPTIEGRWRRSRAYGIAVLSRRPLRDVEVIELPRSSGRERRVAVVATVDDPAGAVPPITVAGTHLEAAAAEEALGQLDVILECVARRSGPCVLAGDLNLRPHQVESRLAGAGFVSAPTGLSFPADRPTIQIDWIATAGMAEIGAKVTHSEAFDAQVSDHRPIAIQIEILPKN